MSENCNHDCSSCGESCKDRDPKSMLQAPHEMSSIKNVIAVVSGKGGVGKSLVTSLLASSMQKKGYHSAVIDADITGPSIPKAFGIHEKAYANEMGLIPVKSRGGIDVMSINLLLDNDTDPVLWRGPIIAGAVSQFWTDVIWENVDYMFVDMPPGTGDVPLTVFQSLPLKGIIVVTSPQELVSVIVEKAVKMAEMMNIPTARANTVFSAKAISMKSLQDTELPPYPSCPSTLQLPPPVTKGKSKRWTRPGLQSFPLLLKKSVIK